MRCTIMQGIPGSGKSFHARAALTRLLAQLVSFKLPDYWKPHVPWKIIRAD